MDEAEYLADRIMVLCAGRVVAEGTPLTLGGQDHMRTAISFTLPDDGQARDLPPAFSPLAEPGPGGSTVVHSESPLVHLRMLGDWALVRGFDLRAFARNRQAQFFTLALPVLFLVIFASVFGGGHTTQAPGGPIGTSASYVPGFLLIVTAWGAAGLLLALRTHRWQPLGR